MDLNSSVWLQNAILELGLLNEAEYQKEVSKLLDDQPHIMGWLFNIGEDFTEPVHELIIRSSIALFRSLAETGLYFKVITPEMLETVINANVEAFENLEEQNPEGYTEQAIFELASSPIALKGLYGFVDGNVTELELPFESRSNLLLVLSSVIEVFEQAANPDQEG